MLETLVRQESEAIAGRWVELVLATEPAETREFLRREGDPFANPVGHTVREAAVPLVEAVAADDPERAMEPLRDLMRIRSLRDLTASEAVAVVVLLRRAFTEAVPEPLDPAAEAELGQRIERLLLAAFDAFTECRERLHEARNAERERHRASLLARAERILARAGEGSTAAPVEAVER